MGNRAIIKADGSPVAIYLHWNGGRDSVEAFLKYCELRGDRAPEYDGYGWARLCQVIGNFFGGTLSIGLLSGEASGEYCDNGAYVIQNWKIVRREDFEGEEQQNYDLLDMLLDIDEAQPEPERLGKDFLESAEVTTDTLNIGDMVYVRDLREQWNLERVIGFGNGIVNGHDVTGVPYVDRFGNGNPERNINNYIRTETIRKKTA